LGFWEPAEAEYVERGVGVLYGLVRVFNIRQGEVYIGWEKGNHHVLAGLVE